MREGIPSHQGILNVFNWLAFRNLDRQTDNVSIIYVSHLASAIKHIRPLQVIASYLHGFSFWSHRKLKKDAGGWIMRTLGLQLQHILHAISYTLITTIASR